MNYESANLLVLERKSPRGQRRFSVAIELSSQPHDLLSWVTVSARDNALVLQSA